MAWRAAAALARARGESGEELLVECGVAWFAHGDDGWEADSERTLAAQGIPTDRVDPTRLYPSFRGDDVTFVLLEPEAGVLRAGAVRALVRQAEAHGARLVRGRARPKPGAALLEDGTSSTAMPSSGLRRLARRPLRRVRPATGHSAGTALLRCRPGLGEPPHGSTTTGRCTARRRRRPGGQGLSRRRGTAARSRCGSPPTQPPASRRCAPLRDRFPALAGAPLRAARSCRYELTADTNFVAAPHPEQRNVWLVGGGSGHGFKHGPALAERIAGAILGAEPLRRPSRWGAPALAEPADGRLRAS